MQLKPETEMNRDSSSVHGWMDEYKNRAYHVGERINPFIYRCRLPFSF